MLLCGVVKIVLDRFMGEIVVKEEDELENSDEVDTENETDEDVSVKETSKGIE